MTTDVRWTHTDNDGDRLEVRAGILGSVFSILTPDVGYRAGVAVRREHLPALIAALQDIHAEFEGTES